MHVRIEALKFTSENDMSEIANKRKFLEAAQSLVKERDPTVEQVEMAILTLSKVVSDLAGEEVMLMPKSIKELQQENNTTN